MVTQVASGDVERFRGIVATQFGLQFDDTKLDFLAGVLRRRLDAVDLESQRYLWRLENREDDHESGSLAQELTVGETYFFRNREQFDALVAEVLPQRLAARRQERRLNVLSAGCASGEEAYTLAMVLREALPDASWSISIRAVDLNAGALERARTARYGSWSLRETPADMRRRWFRPAGRDWVLIGEIASAVSFERRNLAVDDADLWRVGAYDIVFCRNVLMYFSPERMRAVVGRIAGALAPGGHLFLGHAETLRGLSDDFHLLHSNETFYYRLKDADGVVPPRPLPPIRPTPVPAPSSVASSTDWFDVIGRSSDRIRALGDGLEPSARPAERPAPSVTRAPVLALIRAEKYAEALAYVGAAPGSDRDPDLLLLTAVLLVHSGQLAAAAEVAGRLVAMDELSAGGHYLLALCADSGGDIGGAVDHDRIAVYLDPEFAMPRLHLGLLAKRSGDLPAARRELDQALLLLRREDTSRLLLFGGGFTREGLVAMCEAELAAIRGRS
jgi:chemotaxis protein methyltransferase CheR